MRGEQDQNRNEWVQLSQGNYLESPRQHQHVPEGHTAIQSCLPDGYAPAQGYSPVQGFTPIQGYAPAGPLNGYSDYSNPTASMNDCNVDDDDETTGEEVHGPISSRRRKRKSKSLAKPKEEQPRSRRAELRERIAKEHQGAVSSTDNVKGLVEWHEGVFMWWDSEDKVWLRANYHDQYRDQFIMEDSAIGNYVVAPERGNGVNDITSCCAAFNQSFWQLSDRDSWGNIVDARGNKVMYLLDRPDNQVYDEPERLWIHDGCVLLDGDDNPVRPWAGIPRCFSSKIEGGRIEALRRIIPMTIQDFRARMLRDVPTRAGTKPLSYPSTFGHRSSRFRAQYQCPAWISRAASEILRRQVVDSLPEAEEATTTEGLQRLTKYEVERRKSLTRGQYLYKARGRSISEAERKERERKSDEKLARQAASQPRTPQRLQSMPAIPTQSAYTSPYLPTPPLSAGNKRRRESDDLGELEFGQPEPATKRGRSGASPLDPRMQGRSSTPQAFPRDSLQRAPEGYGDSGTINPKNLFHSPSGSSANEHGLGFRGGTSANVDTPIPDQNTSRPEATTTSATASTNEAQRDHRFIHPQTPLQQLRVQAALFYPRGHYYALTGEHAPHTSSGSYSEQYLKILTLLEQKWPLPGAVPYLADVGPWNGSFDMVPVPDLPDRVVRGILSPIGKSSAAGVSVSEGERIEDVAHGSPASGECVDGPTAQESSRVLEQGGKGGSWSDDLFGGYLEDADGEEDLF